MKDQTVGLEIDQCGFTHKFTIWEWDLIWHLIESFSPNAVRRWPEGKLAKRIVYPDNLS